MPDVNFTFRADEALKDAFIRKAKKDNRNASILLRDYMRHYVESDSQGADTPRPTAAGTTGQPEAKDGQ